MWLCCWRMDDFWDCFVIRNELWFFFDTAGDVEIALILNVLFLRSGSYCWCIFVAGVLLYV